QELIDDDATQWDRGSEENARLNVEATNDLPAKQKLADEIRALERLKLKSKEASESLPESIGVDLQAGKDVSFDRVRNLLQVLKQMPSVIVHLGLDHEHPEALRAVVRDPQINDKKTRGQQGDERRQAIRAVLEAAGVEHIGWAEFEFRASPVQE